MNKQDKITKLTDEINEARNRLLDAENELNNAKFKNLTERGKWLRILELREKKLKEVLEDE